MSGMAVSIADSSIPSPASSRSARGRQGRATHSGCAAPARIAAHRHRRRLDLDFRSLIDTPWNGTRTSPGSPANVARPCQLPRRTSCTTRFMTTIGCARIT
jgi:hypothetical protein